MKRMLFATSALVGASLFAGGVANAAMMAPAVKFSGKVEVTYRSVDEKVPGNLGSLDGTITGSELGMAFDGETDAGWTYGGSLTINPGKAAVSTDGAKIYIGGAFGKVELGRVGSAAATSVKGKDALPVGGHDTGKYTDGYISSGIKAGFGVAGDKSANGVNYSTSSLLGDVVVSASYTPNTGDGYDTVFVSDADGYLDLIGIGVKYTGDFGDFGVEAAAAYGTATPAIASERVKYLTDVTQNENLEDLSSIHAGVKVSLAGGRVAIGYGSNGNTGCAKDDDNCDGGNWLDFGAGYGFGPVDVGVGYLSAQKKEGGNDQKRTSVALEGAVTPADGLKAFGGFISNEDDLGNGSEKVKSSVIIVGTSVSF